MLRFSALRGHLKSFADYEKRTISSERWVTVICPALCSTTKCCWRICFIATSTTSVAITAQSLHQPNMTWAKRVTKKEALVTLEQSTRSTWNCRREYVFFSRKIKRVSGVGHDALSSWRRLSAFRQNVSPPLYPEDEGNMFPRNTGNHPQDKATINASDHDPDSRRVPNSGTDRQPSRYAPLVFV